MRCRKRRRSKKLEHDRLPLRRCSAAMKPIAPKIMGSCTTSIGNCTTISWRKTKYPRPAMFRPQNFFGVVLLATTTHFLIRCMAYDAHVQDDGPMDPLTMGLYQDPNCLKSPFWSQILRKLHACSADEVDQVSTVAFADMEEDGTTSSSTTTGNEVTTTASGDDEERSWFEETAGGSGGSSGEEKQEAKGKAAPRLVPPKFPQCYNAPYVRGNRVSLAGYFMRNFGLDALLNNNDPCLLGAYTLFMFNIWNSWNGGSMHGTLVNFANLNDNFLEGMTPQFYEKSVWPLKDSELRVLRAEILYNIRKYRQHFLTTNASATEEDGGQVYRDEMRRQVTQRARRPFVDVPQWESTPFHAYTGNPIRNTPQTKVRIYVYDDGFGAEIGKLTTGASFCHRRQWGSDVGFYDFFRQAPEMTKDPDEADFFFVPGFALCLQVAGYYTLEELDRIYSALMSKLTYFSRNGGRDHIFTFHYQDVFRSWRKYIPHSIFLTPETEVGFELSISELGYDPTRQPVFDTRKDIVTPPFMEFKHVLGLLTFNRPIRARNIFASFAGKLWADVAEAYEVRSSMKRELSQYEDCHIHAENSMAQLLRSREMYALMGDSRFCLVPRGRAAWSVRFFETMWAGCVPVILSDHFETPFEGLFDVSKFAIKWPVAKMGELYDYLKKIPLWRLERMLGEAARIRCWYLYTQPEISWLGNPKELHSQHQLEDVVCPNLGSSRNAYQAVLELLSRKVRKSPQNSADGGPAFFFPNVDEMAPLMETEVRDNNLTRYATRSAESSALIPVSR